MSVQDICNLKSSNELNFEQRLRFKESGRPKPNLELKQTTKDRGKDIHRYFRQSFYELSEWICGCSVKNAFFCFPCLLFCEDSLWTKTGVTDIKHLKEKVKKHGLSTVHLNASMNLAALGRTDIRQQLSSAYRKSIKDYNEQVTKKNRYILNRIIECVKFCGAFELALRGHDESDLSANPGIFRGLLDLMAEVDTIFKEHIEKSSIFKGVSKTIQNELLDSMLAIYHNQIVTEIEQSDFVAIQADETTDISNKTQLVIIFRYVLNDTVCEHFWKFINPAGTTANHITDEILRELEISKISQNPEKLIAQSYDGAAVMSGKLGGVQVKVRELYKHANFIHCYAHQLNLILQKAASQNKMIKKFFANLQAFSTFFSKSPKRTAVLDEVVKARLPKSAPTRWCFNARCVETIYIYQSDILSCLEKIMDMENDSSCLNQCGGLINYLKDDTFLYWLRYFHFVMPHVEILFQQLQKRVLDVISTRNYISNFEKNIEKVRNTVLNDSEGEPSTSKRRRTDDSKRQIAIEVCDIILCEIKTRFTFNDHLIIAQLFYKENFASFEVFSPNLF
jgi:hypothetical protein